MQQRKKFLLWAVLPLLALALLPSGAKATGALFASAPPYTPPQTITLNLSATEIFTDQNFSVTGIMPSSVGDNTTVRIEFVNIDAESVATVPDVVFGGKFTRQLSIPEPGAYKVTIEAGRQTDGGLIVSPTRDLLVKPNVGTISTFYFSEGFTVGVGEQRKIDNLMAQDQNRYWNVSNPLFGVTYSVANPSIASVRNGVITGHRQGTTEIRAAYRGYRTAIDVIVD